MLIVLVGARGAGKTTLLNRLRTDDVEILQPSTTRSKRHEAETEYDFVTGWDEDLYAWGIPVNGQTYGMRKAELAKAVDSTCVTVFEPANLAVFEGLRRTFSFATLTIGLDTIATLDEQKSRVDGAKSRLMDEKSFKIATEVVATCDVVLSGDVETVAAALRACVATVNGRHGVLTKELLLPLIAAGSVLADADLANLRSASYDLRIGPEVWCQGKLVRLTEDSPRFQIPAYSYAIVSAYETAKLPPFMVGRFDLKVSYFFEGIILSNGPQVDPGYKGALFCMLYNGSGRPKLISLKRQFATIDFTATATVTEGYKQKYQFEQRMERFMTDEALTGRGGEIVDLIDKKVDVIDKQLKSIKVSFWAVAGAVIVVTLAIPTISIPLIWNEFTSLHTDKVNIDDAQRREAQLLAEATRERSETLRLLRSVQLEEQRHAKLGRADQR